MVVGVKNTRGCDCLKNVIIESGGDIQVLEHDNDVMIKPFACCCLLCERRACEA